MTELQGIINKHGKLIYKNPIGELNTLYGYIRAVKDDHIIWQDSEYPDKFKIHNIQSFEPRRLKRMKYKKIKYF